MSGDPAPASAGRNLTVPSGETTINSAVAMGNAGGTEIVLPAGVTVNLKKGGFILDVTYNPTGGPGGPYGTVNGYFYQLDSVTLDNQNQLHLVVQGTLRADVRTLVVMENVVAVLEKGIGWKP